MTEPREAEEEKLTPRQQRFANEYVIDLNGTKAAIRAGYSPHTADVQASQLLAQLKIKDYIEKLKEQRAAAVNMSAETVLEEVSTLAKARHDWFAVDMDGNVYCTEHAPEGAMGAIASVKRRISYKMGKGDDESITKTVEVDIRLWDKPGALKLMGKHIGVKGFTDKLELTGPDGGPIEIAEVKRSIVKVPAPIEAKQLPGVNYGIGDGLDGEPK